MKLGISTFARVLLGSAVILTGASYSAPSVHAAQLQLHEMLFKRKKRNGPRVVRPSPFSRKKIQNGTPTTAVAKPRAKIKRVAGPRYYTYKAPKIATYSLVGLLSDPISTSSVNEIGVPTMDFEAQRFSEALRSVPEGQLAIEPSIAKAVKAHYAANPEFIWSRGSSVTAEAKALAAMLGDAAAHGLNPSDYQVTVPSDQFSIADPAQRTAALLTFELQLTAHAIRFAMDMKDGAVNPNLISGYHDFSKDRLKPADALIGLSSASQPAVDYVNSLVPKQPQYALLQNELVVLQGSEDDEIVFPDKVFMKPGGVEDALPLLMKAMNRKMRAETREKHAEFLASYDGSLSYDGPVVELVRDVQRDLGLVPDGIVGPKTVAQLGGTSLATKIKRVELALERLRWHPEEYGRRQVVINQPEYRVRYMENDETKLAMRAIVGKPSNQTNFFHDEIETVVFNPYWGVPQSIIVNEMLPKLQRDPGYLDRAGYVVTSHSGTKIASSAINWAQYSGPVPYNVRQKPGPRNALGELKILFPNKHAIYMHDTPAKKLFARESRAYSHGCVRLQDPRAMAAAVLGKSVDYVASNLGGYEKAEKVSEKIPVYVAYFTAWPNDNGKVEFHPDVYKRDMYLTRAFDAIKSARNEAS
ncbi:MAG: L,D-transpeptidase family protein [Pseudomonadota bacterium]